MIESKKHVQVKRVFGTKKGAYDDVYYHLPQIFDTLVQPYLAAQELESRARKYRNA